MRSGLVLGIAAVALLSFALFQLFKRSRANPGSIFDFRFSRTFVVVVVLLLSTPALLGWLQKRRIDQIYASGNPLQNSYANTLAAHQQQVQTLLDDGKIADSVLASCLARDVDLYASRIETSIFTDLPRLRCVSSGREGARITDLRGIELFSGLKEIVLDHHGITDISALRALLRLEKISLIDNPIDDIRSLRHLPALEYLWLDGTQITDIEPLLDLPHLAALSVDNTPIASIDGLQSIYTLREISLYDTEIRVLQPLLLLPNLTKISLPASQNFSCAYLYEFLRRTQTATRHYQSFGCRE